MAERKSRAGLFVGIALAAVLVAALVVFLVNLTGSAPQEETGVRGVPSDPTGNFMARVLGSTERFWAEEFKERRLPTYGMSAPTKYTDPTLVLFDDAVLTGCGGVSAAAGPMFCMRDHKLYIDPSFYDELAHNNNAPGDFAQAMVIAHEVAHHVQDLISAGGGPRDETENRQSVRFELQADCFAGAWGHAMSKQGLMDSTDLPEALTALNNIGDDVLMRPRDGSTANPAAFTHGTGLQRRKWFERGFAGDARDCDTFALAYEVL
jgi:predicted metalloprotease